jgi:hypothetical protein
VIDSKVENNSASSAPPFDPTNPARHRDRRYSYKSPFGSSSDLDDEAEKADSGLMENGKESAETIKPTACNPDDKQSGVDNDDESLRKGDSTSTTHPEFKGSA